MGLLIGIMLRPDSTKVFEAFIDDLAGFLNQPDPLLREGVVMLLGGTWPVASPGAIESRNNPYFFLRSVITGEPDRHKPGLMNRLLQGDVGIRHTTRWMNIAARWSCWVRGCQNSPSRSRSRS